MSLVASVQAQLRPSDKAVIAREFVRKQAGERTKVLLALVSHPTGQDVVEHSVFLYTRSLFGRLSLKGIWALSTEFYLTVVGERECEMHFSPADALEVEAPNGEALNSWVEAVALAEDAAKSSRPPPGVLPFQWLSPYLPAAVPRPARRAVSDDEPGGGTATADDIDALSARLERASPAPPPDGAAAPLAVAPPPAMLLDSRKIVRAREAWVRRQMRAREGEYTEFVPLTVACCTWNVNGQPPPPDLGDWVDAADDPDVVAVGFQEIVPLSANSVLWAETSPEVTGPWEERLASALARGGTRYAKVASRQLVGVHLVLFAKQALVDEGSVRVAAAGVDAAGVGIMGVMGNKGGVACRLLAHDSALHFVTAHLSAHDANVERRNYDQREILRRLSFAALPSEPVGALDCDTLFVFGDLNYRLALSPALMLQDVEAALKAGAWSKALAGDQLTAERRAGRAFEGFEEGPIDFAPSYKYKVGTDEYVRRKDGGLRPPAWCDRVLWRDAPNADPREPPATKTELRRYRRHELTSSDHRPVSALFAVQARRVDRGREAAVVEALHRRLDALENDSLPQVRFQPPSLEVDFGVVEFESPVTRHVVVENTGQFVAAWRLLPKPGEERVCAPWLRVEPQEGIVGPGETAEIALTARVTRRTARPLTEEAAPLNEILVLHLDHGRDYFITASGRYCRTCFGCSLDYLASRSQPVRAPSLPAGAEAKPASPRRARVPREIIRLVEHLMEPESHMAQRGLFLEGGDPREVAALRDCLDTGDPFPPSASVHSVAETLVRLLDSAETPVVPLPAQARLLAPLALPTAFGANLPALPDPSEVMAGTPVHLVTFSYIAAFLREVLRHSETNRLSPDDLAAVFAEVLLRPPGAGGAVGAAGGAGREATRRRRAFLAQYLGSL